MTFIIGTPHTHNSGYYRNDDTPSGGSLSEADIQTCTHCQKILKMNLWKEDGGFCGRCMAPICGTCADKMLTNGCEPFIKQIEQSLESDYKKKQFRKIAGLDPEYVSIIYSGQK